MDGFAVLVVLGVIFGVQHQVHGIRNCDVSQGNWVHDDLYPLYKASSCPFLEKKFDCVKNGRPDKDYLKYGWQPLGCNLLRWDLIEDGGKIIGKDMNRFVAYEKALNTWATWVEFHVNPAKTKVFFQGVSPDHSNSSDWDDLKAGSCNAQTEPLPGPSYPHVHPAEKIVEKVLGAMSKPVELLDITTLSQLRKDGHPSFYGLGGHKASDCSH